MQLTEKKTAIGMVHIQALPGSPLCHLSMTEIIDQAVQEATLLQNCGLDAVLLENMHDIPYLRRIVGEETIASMAVLADRVRKAIDIPLGIQILAGANKAALAIAQAAGLEFIRAEGFVYGHLADEGYMDSDAGELLRYRKNIGADEVFIYTDIKKKHSSHAITADVSIAETAKAAEFFLSDGLIVSGRGTGEECNLEDLEAVRSASSMPLIIGSGITYENIDKYWNLADAFIIGSHFKLSGYWGNAISEERVLRFMERFHSMPIQQ